MEDSVEEMLDRLSARVRAKFQSGKALPAPPAYWISVWDETGFACSEVDFMQPLYELAREQGVIACAFVGYYLGPERTESLMAQVVGNQPPNSDQRVAQITR